MDLVSSSVPCTGMEPLLLVDSDELSVVLPASLPAAARPSPRSASSKDTITSDEGPSNAGCVHGGA